MTPELKERIAKEAVEYATKHSSAPDKETPDWIIADYKAGATAWAELVEALEKWKAEATILLDPLIAYGQAHPEIKLGACCTEFILNRAKRYDAILERAEKLREALERISDENEIDGLHVFDLMEIAKKALENYKKETA